MRSSLYWNVISDSSCIQKSVLLFYPLSNWRWVNQTLGLRIHYIARASIINVWTHFCLLYLIIIFHHNLRMEFLYMYEWSCSARSEKGRNRRGNRRKLCKLVNIDVDKFDTSYQNVFGYQIITASRKKSRQMKSSSMMFFTAIFRNRLSCLRYGSHVFRQKVKTIFKHKWRTDTCNTVIRKWTN